MYFNNYACLRKVPTTLLLSLLTKSSFIKMEFRTYKVIKRNGVELLRPQCSQLLRQYVKNILKSRKGMQATWVPDSDTKYETI